MKKKSYTNLPYKRIYLFRFLFFMLLIESAILTYFAYTTVSLDVFLKVSYVVTAWTLIIFLIPMLILYFNYSKYNKNTVLNLSIDSINIESKSKKSTFELDDIDYVEFNLSFPLYENRWRLAFWDEYYYALIKLKNGEKHIITCLLCDELQELIPAHLIKKRKRFFPLVEMRTTEEIAIKKHISDKSELERKSQVFINKLKHKSVSELQEIINNKTQYLPEAIEAAKKLLELQKNAN